MAEFITTPSVDDVYRQLKGYMREIRKQAVDFRTKCVAGPVGFTTAREFMETLKGNLDGMASRATAYPAKVLGDYAIAQENKPGYDPVAAYTDVVAAATTVLNTLATALPAKGGATVEQFKYREPTFSTTETATFLPQLTALIGSIGAP